MPTLPTRRSSDLKNRFMEYSSTPLHKTAVTTRSRPCSRSLQRSRPAAAANDCSFNVFASRWKIVQFSLRTASSLQNQGKQNQPQDHPPDHKRLHAHAADQRQKKVNANVGHHR